MSSTSSPTSVQHGNALMEKTVNNTSFAIYTCNSSGVYTLPISQSSKSQAAKTPGRHILRSFSIKWVAGTIMVTMAADWQ